jgi:hypothetical protein
MTGSWRFWMVSGFAKSRAPKILKNEKAGFLSLPRNDDAATRRLDGLVTAFIVSNRGHDRPAEYLANLPDRRKGVLVCD